MKKESTDESPANAPFFHPRQMVANGGFHKFKNSLIIHKEKTNEVNV